MVELSEEKFNKLQQQALNSMMNDFSMASDSSDSPMKKMNFGKTGSKRQEPNWASFENPGPVSSGDLEFNDLEIAFDKR